MLPFRGRGEGPVRKHKQLLEKVLGVIGQKRYFKGSNAEEEEDVSGLDGIDRIN